MLKNCNVPAIVETGDALRVMSVPTTLTTVVLSATPDPRTIRPGLTSALGAEIVTVVVPTVPPEANVAVVINEEEGIRAGFWFG